MGRRVRAVVTVGEQILGAVPVFGVESPWWPDVEPVTGYLDALLGERTTVLRMLRVVGGENPRGGEVTYHVEAAAPPAFELEPVDWRTRRALLREHPLRAPWARPGAVQEIVAWADGTLDGRRTGPAVQVKTWNLSCLLRLPTADGSVWVKSTRGFESSEPAAMALVAAHDPTLVPGVLADRPGDMLTEALPGEDAWDTDEATVREAIGRWVAVQAALADAPLDGLPDLRSSSLPARVAAALDGAAAHQLAPAEAAAVRALDLPARLEALAATGVPDTLVHGDFHSGNWRRGDGTLSVIDWSDAHRGHPAKDLLCLRSRLPAALGELAARAWCAAWTEHRPGSDPAAALDLARPLAHLDAAATYQRFLDHIEPDEYPYHRDDPATQLRLALASWE